MTAQGASEGKISLSIGHPDPAMLLTSQFQNTVGAFLAQPSAYHALEYGDEQGTPRLIEFLVGHINAQQGTALTPENLMIVAGSTHAVDMIGRLLVPPGQVVIIEAPTYADAIHIFRDHRLELRSVPVDDDGLRVADLEKLLDSLKNAGEKPAFLYTIPHFHNPAGVTTSLERRYLILELARRHHMLIVEDDVYRDLAFDGDPLPGYGALSGGEGVLSIGSFSKTLAPGLRLGWLAASPEIIQTCVNCGTSQMSGGTNPFTAGIVAQYCEDGHWQAYIEELRRVYRNRRDTALAALDRFMPPEVSWTHPGGGFFLWLTLPEGVSSHEIKEAADEAGVLVSGGQGFFIQPEDGLRHLRLAFSFATPEDITSGIQILAEVIKGW